MPIYIILYLYVSFYISLYRHPPPHLSVVRCKVVKASEEVQSATQKHLELQVLEIHAITKADALPFLVEDAGRNEEYAQANSLPTVSQDTALNYRWIDTRTPANQAIFRIQSGVCQFFREFLLKNKFIEIHTPKLISGASEGGSNVFKLDYFDQKACLAQCIRSWTSVYS